jgi:hypothetical protein
MENIILTDISTDKSTDVEMEIITHLYTTEIGLTNPLYALRFAEPG